MQENIGLFLSKRALLCPDQEALVELEPPARWTYAALNADCNRVANGLLARGVAPGDRVALLLKNSSEYVLLFFALAKIGAIIVPLNWRLVPSELEFILSDCGASTLIFDTDFQQAAAELKKRAKTALTDYLSVGQATDQFAPFSVLIEEQPDEEPPTGARGDDILFIVYTSGTTGLPKGAMHSHSSMMWASLTWMAVVDLRPDDRMLIFLPTFHVGVILPLVFVIHRGATAVLLPSFDVEKVFSAFQAEKITTSVAVPTMLKLMIDWEDRKHYDYSLLRWIILGAGAVPAPLLKRYSELGVEILQDYGLTESCGPATIADARDAMAKPASAGKACFHTEVKLVDDDGHSVGPDELGEVIIRSRHIMTGYWKQPEASRQVIRDGWLHTGDLGRMDADGCLYIVDRKKDLIISGGENIAPAEIENLLLTHAAIKDVAVISQPSEKWGESPAAIVVLADGHRLSLADLREYCSGRIASYKIPRSLEFASELPRTPTGKIQKHLLKKLYPGPAPE